MAEHIQVKVGGVAYPTEIDSGGTQRFLCNRVVRLLQESHPSIDLNVLGIMYRNGAFTQREYLEFNMMLGYSVCGIEELSSFHDLEIENPYWGTKSEEAP